MLVKYWETGTDVVENLRLREARMYNQRLVRSALLACPLNVIMYIVFGMTDIMLYSLNIAI